jgi:hypothetical protein
MCGLRNGIRGRNGAISLWEMGLLNLSIGPDRREVPTLVLKATAPGKDFLHLKASHVNCFTFYNIVKYCVYFSPVQVNN